MEDGIKISAIITAEQGGIKMITTTSSTIRFELPWKPVFYSKTKKIHVEFEDGEEEVELEMYGPREFRAGDSRVIHLVLPYYDPIVYLNNERTNVKEVLHTIWKNGVENAK